MKSLNKFLVFLERFLGSSLLFIILILLTVSVFSRYVLRKPITWTDELSTFLFMFMTFLGASYAINQKAELIVNVLYERFPRFQKPLDYFLDFSRGLAAITLIISGYKYYVAEKTLQTLTPLCQIPYHWVASLVGIFGILVLIKSIYSILELIKR
jgi:TRAP-type C4-dicarboxylate transport system permease small subunit